MRLRARDLAAFVLSVALLCGCDPTYYITLHVKNNSRRAAAFYWKDDNGVHLVVVRSEGKEEVHAESHAMAHPVDLAVLPANELIRSEGGDIPLSQPVEKELKDAGAPKVTERQMEKQSDAELTIEDDMQIRVW